MTIRLEDGSTYGRLGDMADGAARGAHPAVSRDSW